MLGKKWLVCWMIFSTAKKNKSYRRAFLTRLTSLSRWTLKADPKPTGCAALSPRSISPCFPFSNVAGVGQWSFTILGAKICCKLYSVQFLWLSQAGPDSAHRDRRPLIWSWHHLQTIQWLKPQQTKHPHLRHTHTPRQKKTPERREQGAARVGSLLLLSLFSFSELRYFCRVGRDEVCAQKPDLMLVGLYHFF